MGTEGDSYSRYCVMQLVSQFLCTNMWELYCFKKYCRAELQK